MNFFFTWIFACLLVLGGCQFLPPLPKQPDESDRILINKTYPPELEES